MKAQKVRIIQIVLYSLLILFCIGFYAYEVMVKQVDPTENITRMFLIIVCCVIGILRSKNPAGRGSLDLYAKSYVNEIRNAFSADKKAKKELLTAVRFYDENRLSKAIRILNALRKKCKQTDDFYAVYLFSALSYTDMHLYDEAIKEYEYLISNCMDTCIVYNNLGHIYSLRGKKDDAIYNYEKAISLSPEYEYAYVNMANLYFTERELDLAIDYALKALDINSKQTSAANMLAVIYALKEDDDNAEKYFHMAISSGSNPEDLKQAIEHFKSQQRG